MTDSWQKPALAFADVVVFYRCIAVVDNTHAALRIEVCGHLKKMLLRRNQLAKALP